MRALETTEGTRVRMSRQRARDTDVELALHGLGLRYRVHRRPIPAVRRGERGRSGRRQFSSPQ